MNTPKYFSDFLTMPPAHYQIEIHLKSLNCWLTEQIDDGLNINPDFQREHVWTEKQQIKYLEWILAGGKSGLEIMLNHPNWLGNFKGEYVLVDGKQRIKACLEFLNNKLPAFGLYLKDFADKPSHVRIKISIAKVQTRKEVLQWYLKLNSEGTPHTSEELDKVKQLLTKEKL